MIDFEKETGCGHGHIRDDQIWTLLTLKGSKGHQQSRERGRPIGVEHNV